MENYCLKNSENEQNTSLIKKKTSGGFSLWVYQVSHFVIVLMLSYENISWSWLIGWIYML